MQAKADGYWSQDGATWVKINYGKYVRGIVSALSKVYQRLLTSIFFSTAEEGGGTTTVPFFSSQEWTQTVVDTNAKYIGRWGLTVHSFNRITGEKVSYACIVACLCVQIFT